MKFDSTTTIGALFLLLATVSASHGDYHKDLQVEVLERLERRTQHTQHKHHQRHSHARLHASPRAESSSHLKKRATCQFPHGVGIIPVTPKAQNGGWAMSPDEPCTAGKYCPYACPPGELMAQWDPDATEYTYPASMNGGLYCNDDGTVSKPFPKKPYCYPGTGSIAAVNKCGGSVAFCQTVLPGNEAMLIATNVDASATLAVPGTDYWASTAAHYYINPPGVSTEEGCIWGDGSKPVGNWSPYVAGANTDGNGNTFVKVAWNPIYTGESVFQNNLPKFGVRITCDGGGCNGLPCSIDPSTVSVNGVTSGNSATGAGGGNFCVVTVQKGSQAKIETFDVGGSSSGGSKNPGVSQKADGEVKNEPEPEPEVEEPEPEPTQEPTPEPTPEPEPEPTPEPEPEPTPTPTPTPTSTPSSSKEEEVKVQKTTLQKVSTSASPTTSSASSRISVKPHIFYEQNNSTDSSSQSSSSSSFDDESTSSTESTPTDSTSDEQSGTTTDSSADPATSTGAAAATRAGSAGSMAALAAALIGCNFLL